MSPTTICLICLLILIIFFFQRTYKEEYTSLPIQIVKSGVYKLPSNVKTIYAYGGGGGGAAVNAYTQNIYPGGGGGSGFAVSADVTPDIKYISVSMGYGGPSDTKGGDTVLQLLSADKYVLKTLIAEGGMPGQLGYLNKYNIPYGGNGGAGYCGGGGGGMGQFPYHQPSIPGTGGMGVVSQNMGQSGNLGVPIESMLPSGGDGGCNRGSGGPAFNNLGGGGGGGGPYGGQGAPDDSKGSPGQNAIGYSAGGGGAAFGPDASASQYVYLGGSGLSGYVLLN